MYTANYTHCFGDKRLERRGEALSRRLFESGRTSIQSLSLTRAEQKAFYRLLGSRKVSERKLVTELAGRCSKAARGKLVLAIQDTTEINLSSHSGRLNKSSGVGSLDGAYAGQMGFKVHPSLVLDACTGFPLGYSAIRIWERPFDQPLKRARDYQRQPIEEKESYKWLDTSEQSKDCLQQADAVIIVQDREGDIFEQFARLTDQRTYLLVRSRVNRNLEHSLKLWDELGRAALCGTYMHQIATHGKGSPRQAQIEVRFIQATVKSPAALGLPPQTLYAVEAREVSAAGHDPMRWRLLTNWPVENFEQARLVIAWYTCRWVIEEVFRLLKKEGFNLEQSELESGWAIRKLCVLLLDTVLKILQLHMAYHMPEGDSPEIGICFDPAQQQCLAVMNQKAQGSTPALQNPFPRGALKWAAWIIARSGGWKGYRSQRPPGMTTLWRGLQRFCDIYQGWILSKDVGTP